MHKMSPQYFFYLCHGIKSLVQKGLITVSSLIALYEKT